MHHTFIDNVLSPLSTPSLPLTAREEAEFLEPYTYLQSSPGKNVCNQLIQALNYWLRVPSAHLEAIVRVIERLHNCSVSRRVDDIEDGSELRRGKPSAHKIYGIPQTINAANYAYFVAYQEVLEISCLGQIERSRGAQCPSCSNSSRPGSWLVQILNDEMLALHRGQGREMLWRDHTRCPTEEEYIGMVKDKTAGILRLAVRLMMECATTNTDVNYVPLVELLGIWYQIRDDYMNLQSDTYAETKGFAEDLTEGKFSFPVIHGIREKPEDKFLTNILHQRPRSPAVKRETIAYLEEVTCSFKYTLNVLGSLEAQTRAEATRLGGNPALEEILNKLAIRD